MVEKLLAPLSDGASLTLETVRELVAVAVLKALVPPLLEVSTLLPAVPLVWSQARKVTEADVPFCPSGTKRSLSVERSSSAALLDTEPTAFQVLPALVEYCQTPVPLLKPVTALPSRRSADLSLILPLISVDTRSPLLLV